MEPTPTLSAPPAPDRDVAVVLAGNAGYALPMLIAARSLVARASRRNFEVCLFAVDFDNGQLARVRDAAAHFGGTVTPLDSRAFLGPDGLKFRRLANNPHIDPTTLARLVTGAHIAPDLARVLYVDADTYVVGDLSPLLARPLPEGELLAAPDIITFYRDGSGFAAAQARQYLAGLSMGPDDMYFNGGVLYAARQTWLDCGRECLRYYLENTARCRFHDQSALNATMRSALRPMSLRWNFQTSFRDLGLDSTVAPVLFHFAGPAKPWWGRLPPWSDFTALFQRELADPAWRGLAAAVPPARLARRVWLGHAVQKLKFATYLRGRRTLMRQRVAEFEQRLAVA